MISCMVCDVCARLDRERVSDKYASECERECVGIVSRCVHERASMMRETPKTPPPPHASDERDSLSAREVRGQGEHAHRSESESKQM